MATPASHSPGRAARAAWPWHPEIGTRRIGDPPFLFGGIRLAPKVSIYSLLAQRGALMDRIEAPWKRWKPLALAIALMASFAICAPPARAAGLLVADGGLGGQLEIKEHSVRVVINNGVAVTEVTQ